MHTKQVKILKKLEKRNGLRFSELARDFSYDDKFPYHLKQLLNSKLIYKNETLYYISKEGMQESLTHSTKTLEEQDFKVGIISFIIKVGDSYVIKKKVYNGVSNYFLPRGKLLFGETIEEASRRLLKEEIDYSDARVMYDSIHIRRQLTSNGEVLFDNIVLYYSVSIFPEDICKVVPQGSNSLIKQDEIEKLKVKWPEVDMLVFRRGWKPFAEYDLVCDYNIRGL